MVIGKYVFTFDFFKIFFFVNDVCAPFLRVLVPAFSSKFLFAVIFLLLLFVHFFLLISVYNMHTHILHYNSYIYKKVRMAADAKAPLELRRNYSNVFGALIRIAKEEGVMKLWSGAGPTVVRGCLITGGQLGFYSEAKERLVVLSAGRINGVPLQLLSGLVSASAATAMSCPADVIKSRMQNAYPGQYKGILDCAANLLKYEGVTAFWKGSLPAVIKLTPQSLISLTLLDFITHFLTGSDAM
jgi:hypothetical protein